MYMRKMFDNLNYKKWCLDNKLNDLFGISVKDWSVIESKKEKNNYESVDPKNRTPFPPEFDDLIRLHFLARSRKVTTILEFGVGKSTMVFADAIKKNKEDYAEFVKINLRRANPFEVHSVDNVGLWIDKCKQSIPSELSDLAYFHFSDVEMTTFNSRACTMYKKLPNICPDLIYLDAPDQFNTLGEIRGISTTTPDRLPMSADILLIEPFLLPGTLIVIDGRTANARFLKNNFQRNWEYNFYEKEDIHTFELVERPLGKLNEKQLCFCLGDSWKGLKL